MIAFEVCRDNGVNDENRIIYRVGNSPGKEVVDNLAVCIQPGKEVVD